jgi:CheY-like chemotaxis protein
VAKILCVDDYRMYAEMVGTMLHQKGGHEVKIDVVPLVIDAIVDNAPDVIVINMVRKAEVLGTPIHDFYREVDGAKALQAIANAPELKGIPIVLTSLAVRENEVPMGVRYDAFIEVPHKIESLLHAVDRVVEARRRCSSVAQE